MTWPPSGPRLAPLAPWFDEVKRDLPWRAADLDTPHPDPYAVLVSELMLQQTQVATVVPYFSRWMLRWPTASALAAASEEEVHKAWEGLGYYRRARLLHAAAGRVAVGGWPRDLAGLLDLPGLGPYTAAAVAAQAFQWPEPALDGNAFRVLARLLGLEADPKGQAVKLRDWLRPALAAHGPSRLTQALMELGATVCTPVPRCGRCPLGKACEARRLEATDRIPPATRRTAPKASEFWLVAAGAGGRWLVAEPAEKGLLAGLWRWPSVPLEDASAAPPAGRAAEAGGAYAAAEITGWPPWTQVYSHRRERVNPVRLSLSGPFDAPPGMAWITGARLDALPMGRRDTRLRELLGAPGGSLTPETTPGELLDALRRDAGPLA